MNIKEIFENVVDNKYPQVRLKVPIEDRRSARCNSCGSSIIETYDMILAGTIGRIVGVKLDSSYQLVQIEIDDNEIDVSSGAAGDYTNGHNFDDYEIIKK